MHEAIAAGRDRSCVDIRSCRDSVDVALKLARIISHIQMWAGTNISEPGTGAASAEANGRVLTVSPNLPSAMERRRWCLRDYTIQGTLYQG